MAMRSVDDCFCRLVMAEGTDYCRVGVQCVICQNFVDLDGQL